MASVFISLYCYLEFTVTNQSVKNLLVEHFGDEICFTYPQNMRNSQVFFSANIRSRDIVESLRSNNPVKICVEKLRKECTEFDFFLIQAFVMQKMLKIALKITRILILSHGKNFSIHCVLFGKGH